MLILGMILRNERLKNNLTLEELSKLTNISESELDKIELGKIKTPSSVSDCWQSRKILKIVFLFFEKSYIMNMRGSYSQQIS